MRFRRCIFCNEAKSGLRRPRKHGRSLQAAHPSFIAPPIRCRLTSEGPDLCLDTRSSMRCRAKSIFLRELANPDLNCARGFCPSAPVRQSLRHSAQLLKDLLCTLAGGSGRFQFVEEILKCLRGDPDRIYVHMNIYSRSRPKFERLFRRASESPRH